MSMLLIFFDLTAAAAIECLRLYNCNFKPTLNFAQNRFTIGKASKLAVLNAQVDLNTDKVTLLRQKNYIQIPRHY
jgi:outer membrane protein TolC